MSNPALIPDSKLFSRRVACISALARGLSVSLVTQLMACGVIGLGGNPSLNDPVPNGTLKRQGVFQSCSPEMTVTGRAEIYQTTTGDVLRLVSLSIVKPDGSEPIAGLLDVAAQHSGSTVSSVLRSTRGNQNYPLSGGTQSWNAVHIRPLTNPTNINYCSASLSVTN